MWTLASELPVPHWRPSAAPPSTVLAFSTRRGGTSPPPFDTLNVGRSTEDDPAHVRETRARLLDALGLRPDRLATAGQVAGARVVEATAPGHHPDCDALVTTAPGLVLAVTIADCMALLYTAPGGVAVAHSGWRGTADGMPVAALEALCDRARVGPEAVSIHIGPCIRGCCYEVGPEIAALFPAEAVRPDGPRPRLDLPTAARSALLAAGVPGHAIHDTGACTACEPYWYFSHRRDAGRTGRMWGMAARIASG